VADGEPAEARGGSIGRQGRKPGCHRPRGSVRQARARGPSAGNPPQLASTTTASTARVTTPADSRGTMHPRSRQPRARSWRHPGPRNITQRAARPRAGRCATDRRESQPEEHAAERREAEAAAETQQPEWGDGGRRATRTDCANREDANRGQKAAPQAQPAGLDEVVGIIKRGPMWAGA